MENKYDSQIMSAAREFLEELRRNGQLKYFVGYGTNLNTMQFQTTFDLISEVLERLTAANGSLRLMGKIEARYDGQVYSFTNLFETFDSDSDVGMLSSGICRSLDEGILDRLYFRQFNQKAATAN